MRCCCVITFCFFLVFISCSLDEPEAPSWNTTLNFPVTEKKYVMSELVEENDNLINYDDGMLGFRIEGDLEKTVVGDNFVLDDIEESFDVQTSDVVIPRMAVGALEFSPTMFIPDAEQTFGQSRTVARIAVSDLGGEVQNDAGPVSASIVSGTLLLDFSNTLPVAIEISEIRLEEFGSGTVKLRHTTPMTIAAKSKAQLELDLSQTSISSMDRWLVSGYCAGSNGHNVIVNQEDALNIQVDLLNVRAESLSAPAHYFHVEQRDSVTIGEAVCIRNATFSAGSITFDVTNRLDFDLNISITSPQFINAVTGGPLAVKMVAAKGKKTSQSIPIEDYSINYEGHLQRPQCVELFVTVQGNERDGQISTRREDSIHFTFGMRDVVIDKFTGRLDRFDVGIKPVEQKVNLPDNIDKLSGLYLQDARLLLDFYNTLEMPLQLDGRLLGKARNGKQQSLDILADVQAGALASESVTRVVFESSDNPDVARLVSVLPETIAFQGHAYVGQGLTEGSLSSESYIRTHYALETPAFFSWNESNFEPDTTFFQINPAGYKGGKVHPEALEIKSNDVESMEEFSLLAKVENHLPVSGSIEFTLYDEPSQSTERVLSLKPVTIQTAELNEFGLVTSSWQDSLVIKLYKDDVHIFQNDGEKPKLVKLVTRMKMHSTDGLRVKVFNEDFLIIKAVARLVVAINKE